MMILKKGPTNYVLEIPLETLGETQFGVTEDKGLAILIRNLLVGKSLPNTIPLMGIDPANGKVLITWVADQDPSLGALMEHSKLDITVLTSL